MTLTVTVHPKGNPAGAAVRTLTACYSRQFQREPNEPGGFSFTLPVNHADAAYIEPGHWIKYTLNGEAVMAGRVGADSAHPISQGEEADETVTIQAAGALAALADMTVQRPEWFGRQKTDMRWFGAMSPEYEGWLTWDPPAFYVRQDYALSPYGVLNPEGWNAGEAGWIWGTDFDSMADPPQAVGTNLFAAVAVVTQGDYRVRITADDRFRLWRNGVFVGENREAFAWKRVDDFDMFLEDGTHYFFIEGENIDRASSSTNGAAILFALFEMVAGGEYGDLVGFSSDAWAALPYPSSTVGMTPGDIGTILMDEAQALDTLLEWTWDFDAELDSNGNAWAVELSIGFRLGLSYLDAFKQMAAHAVDLLVDYDTMTLRMFNKGTLDTTPSVEFVKGTNLLDLTFESTPALATEAQVQDANGEWSIVSSGVATGDGDPPKVWAYVQLGGGDDTDAVDPVLDAFSQPKDRATAQLAPVSGVIPYTDFTEFDTIGCISKKGVANTSSTIKSITMTEPAPSDDGVVDGTQLFTVELEQVAS